MESLQDKILVIGACGQLGSELTAALRQTYGESNVIASDVHLPAAGPLCDNGIFEKLDVLDARRLSEVLNRHHITQVYVLAAVLSATGEKHPKFAWNLNINGLLHVLDAAVEKKIAKIFWPSSIAVFGPHTPPEQTPQYTVTDPNTVYGISKQAGELWCDYYHKKYGLDVRSVRYPGLIGYQSMPGGGTTDYAVDIYYKALEEKAYECFLSENTYLPMMYMPDAIRGTLELMEAEANQIRVRTSYNLAGISFSPEEIAQSIQTFIPDFRISYRPDFRQQIADSWPRSIDDSVARQDWGWKPAYTLEQMTEDMLLHLKHKKATAGG
jgi:nucleoside-diphosphate-sugar epimerase